MAKANVFPNPLCLIWKTNPIYWQTLAAMHAARGTGVITDKDSCHRWVDTVNDVVGLPLGVVKSCGNCASDALFDMKPVVCFEHVDYGGVWEDFDVGEYRQFEGELGDVAPDKISSIVVPPGYRVLIAENEPEHGLGLNRWLDPGQYPSLSAAFGKPYNDMISYLKVERV